MRRWLENFPARHRRRWRERRRHRLFKIADEIALEPAQETLRVGDRDRRLIRVLRTADTVVADSGGWNFKARVTVKVRGADEKGMPDQKEQHKTRRRGRLL